MASQNHLSQLLRDQGVVDEAVLAAIAAVDRALFVPTGFHDQAFDDTPLPIGFGQTISQPYVVATMTAALNLTRRSHVLEIGTGSGYQTAVLAGICRWVRTVECIPELAHGAAELFDKLDLRNVTTRLGDGAKGWPEAAPFEHILVTAAAADFPAALLDQLSEDGGVMVVPIGDQGRPQTLYRVSRQQDIYRYEKLMQVRFVPLLDGYFSRSV